MEKENKKEWIRFIKFTLFSVSAGIIQIGSFTLLEEVFHFQYWPSYLIALVLSVLYNFTINRKFTFKAANNIPIAMLKVALFYLVFTPLSTIGGDFLTEQLHINDYIVLALTMVLNFVLEFLYTRFFVYKNAVDTQPSSKEK